MNNSAQISFENLRNLEEKINFQVLNLRNSDSNCFDEVKISIYWRNGSLEKIFYNFEQACLITKAATNIICQAIKEKNKEQVKKILESYRSFIYEGETAKNQLAETDEMLVFCNLKKFPNRINCVELVIDGILTSFNKKI